jgi:small subunit ribosomal protein S24e
MKVEIIERIENPLLQRTEIKFRVDHTGGPTPKRVDVCEQLAAQLGVPKELIVIEKLASMHGVQIASGIARTYSSREQLEELEPRYLLGRGLPKAKPEEKPPEKPKVERPEKKPPEKPPEKPKPEEKPSKEEAEGVKET